MTRVDYKLGADVNRLRSDVFVLRILRRLTFEVSWRRRRGVLDSKRKMGRRPSACWPVRHAVDAQLDRRGRQRRRPTARTVFCATGLRAVKVVGRRHNHERSR